MKTKTQVILVAMKIIVWVVFIALCVKTSTLLIVYIFGEFISPETYAEAANTMNTSRILIHNPIYFTATSIGVIIIYALKTFMMYQVLQIFLKIDLSNPFNHALATIISKLSGITLAIGLLTLALQRFSTWLDLREEPHNLRIFLDGGDEFVFFAGILFTLSLVFKRGMELQAESELTI